MTDFFVPNSTPEKMERLYAQIAEFCGRSVPLEGQRIRSIEWVHDGDRRVASVGERLRGHRVRTRRRKTGVVEIKSPLSDPATVLAIFAGDS
jgi:hypothetical protein